MSVSLWMLIFSMGAANAALPLPSYMKPCARSDPNFNACALKRAKEVLPNIINGDRKYNIPNLNPLHVLEVKVVDEGPRQAGVKLTLNNVNVYNISDANTENVEFNFDKNHIRLEFSLPSVLFLGKYDISGRVLVLPITGKGDFNLTLVAVKLVVDIDYIQEPTKGNMHLITQDIKLDLKVSRFYIYLDNLFNGDKFLGKQMNEFLNENWEDVYKELSPAIIEAFSQVFLAIINGITKSITFDTLFPETLF